MFNELYVSCVDSTSIEAILWTLQLFLAASFKTSSIIFGFKLLYANVFAVWRSLLRLKMITTCMLRSIMLIKARIKAHCAENAPYSMIIIVSSS